LELRSGDRGGPEPDAVTQVQGEPITRSLGTKER
jgi:hypothetical protein